MDSGKSVDARLFWPNEIPILRILGMNKRNKISSEMFQRAVVKARRCGPCAGESIRPETAGLGRMLFLRAFYLFYLIFLPLIRTYKTFSCGHHDK